MAGLNTIGVTLKYGANAETLTNEVTGVMEIPELGGDVDKIEVTTLKSEAHEYIDGLKNNGDTITFKCLYIKEEFENLNGITSEQHWEINFPPEAKLKATWTGTPSVKMGAVTVGGYLSYSLNIAPTSKVDLVVSA